MADMKKVKAQRERIRICSREYYRKKNNSKLSSWKSSKSPIMSLRQFRRIKKRLKKEGII